MAFVIDTFQSHCKSEHNQVKWYKNTWDMCKPDSIFLFKKDYLNDVLNLFLDEFYH